MTAKVPPNAQRLSESLLALMESKPVSIDELDGMIEWAQKLALALQELRAKRMLSP
jgi:hypothetical protein